MGFTIGPIPRADRTKNFIWMLFVPDQWIPASNAVRWPRLIPLEPGMRDVITNDEYVSWFTYLFPRHDTAWIAGVSAALSLGVFYLGYAIAIVGGLEYPQLNAYVGTVAIFGMVAAIGFADDIYADAWTQVRDAFAVDDETYRDALDLHLTRIHDGRRIGLLTAVFALPYIYIVTVSYLPLAWPFRESVVDIVFSGGELSYRTGAASVVLVVLFGVVSSLLIATIVNGFLNHLALVREVADLPFRDVYASAADLEPLAMFSTITATAWFAGISLIILWMHTSLSGTLGTTMIAVLVVTGIVFFAAPQLILHDALVEAKHRKLVDIRREYTEMYHRMQQDVEPTETLPLELELTDRRLENAKAINTWVYNVSSISKLVAASVIPWLTLLQEVGSVLEFFR